MNQPDVRVLTEFDLYLFGEGNHTRIYDKLGAHPMTLDGVEGVHFAVWAPNANRVSVAGDFNGWDGLRHRMHARGATGVSVGTLGARPERPLELYEFEACPYCRKVREALSVLDLEVLVYPCPKGGARYRERVRQIGGKLLFPYLVDPNREVSMYESDDIMAYLKRPYAA